MLEGIDREGLSFLASWVGRPMNINSVLEELRERKLEVGYGALTIEPPFISISRK